ncbi:MAG: HPr family phosphocarrier protein [Bacteroidales bacterium]|jgi:phosphocarrier protein|nr:HPr family phosphocarrier protein [Bacteroidales bacterium]
MVKIENHVIKDPIGVHARPAGQLVALLKPFSSTVMLEHNGNIQNAKSLIALLKMSIQNNDNISFIIEGTDENETQIALKIFLENNF